MLVAGPLGLGIHPAASMQAIPEWPRWAYKPELGCKDVIIIFHSCPCLLRPAGIA
jgi:hypothetical protein